MLTHKYFMHNDTHVRPHLTHSHTARVTIPQFATQPGLQPQHNKVVTLLLHHASTGAAVALPMTDIGSEAVKHRAQVNMVTSVTLTR